MEQKIETRSTVSRTPQAKSDKIEVVKVLSLAIVSFILGFGLVIAFLRPAPFDTDVDSAPPTAAPRPSHGSGIPLAGKIEEPVASSTQEGYAPVSSDTGLELGGKEAKDKENENGSADAPPEVPPGRTPEGISLDGDAYYLKCWKSDGTEIDGKSCDKLAILEKRVSTRLYVVNKCKLTHAGENAKGILSLGIEVDFKEGSLSFWNGASSDLASAPEIATCLRTELAGLPLSSISHDNERYRLFFTVLFGTKPQKAAAAKAQPDIKKGGKMVDVKMDRVRVRQAPKTGRPIGKISSGNQVRLLEQKDDWCRIITPNGNEGWMICEALDLN
jgi:hypothetical protein